MARGYVQLIAQYVHKAVAWDAGGVEVFARVNDVTLHYGKERLLIQPLAGIGTLWVDAKRCRHMRKEDWDEIRTNEPTDTAENRSTLPSDQRPKAG